MLENILNKEVKGIVTGSLIGKKTIVIGRESGINPFYEEDIIIYEITKSNGETLLGYLKQNKDHQIINGMPIIIYVPRLTGLVSFAFDRTELPDEFNNSKNILIAHNHNNTINILKIKKYKLN